MARRLDIYPELRPFESGRTSPSSNHVIFAFQSNRILRREGLRCYCIYSRTQARSNQTEKCTRSGKLTMGVQSTAESVESTFPQSREPPTGDDFLHSPPRILQRQDRLSKSGTQVTTDCKLRRTWRRNRSLPNDGVMILVMASRNYKV